MDNQLETVESNIGNLDNLVNHMVHMLKNPCVSLKK